MTKYRYSNDFEEYEIVKLTVDGRIKWMVMQDGVFADRSYKKLKDAKRAIENQEIRF